MQIGIIQGRLLPPVNGKIQEFPKDNWQREFELLNVLGLSHIEWVITKDSLEHCLQLDVRKYASRISSICCDHLIDSAIDSAVFLYTNLLDVCIWAIQNGIYNITIPLLEQSDITKINYIRFCHMIKSYSTIFPQLKFHFEVDEFSETVVSLLSSGKNFRFVYDTGNIHFPPMFNKSKIGAMMPYVSNVHLKDKTMEGITVEPGQGYKRFKEILGAIKNGTYNGRFTIQTARGETGKEIDTILRHKKYFEDIYQNC